MKVLIATEKPFAKEAIAEIDHILCDAQYEVVLLEKYSDKSELLAAVADVDAIIIRSDKITAEVIAAAPQLKVVVRAGAGYDNVDLAAATEHGVVVMNTPGQNSNAVAELVVGMMIYMERNEFSPGTGAEIMGKTLAIHAFGNVGKLVARKGKALGMRVIAYDPFVSDEQFEAEGVEKVDSIEKLYRRADALSLHIPVTEKTRQSIGYDLMSIMPNGAILINTARKEVIDEQGICQAMRERSDLRYIADIAPAIHPAMVEEFGKRYFATPKKMGAETAEANINAGLAAARQIVRFFTENDTQFQVNK